MSTNQEMVLAQRGGGALAVPGLEPQNVEELKQLCQLLAASGYFKDASQIPQACVKVLAGREMGIPPIAAMSGISIIDGKPATGANILAACMKRAGYTWTIEQRDAKGVRMTMYFRGDRLGPVEFVEEDAKRAGLLGKTNWTKWPRSMYFARCISDAARTYAPEVFAGIPAYTAEELGASDTTEDGAPIERREAATNTPDIDTGGHPVGTQAAANAVRDRKLAEARQQPAKPAAATSAPVGPAEDPAVVALWKRAGLLDGKGTQDQGIEVIGELHSIMLELAGREMTIEFLKQNGFTSVSDFAGKKRGDVKGLIKAMHFALLKLHEKMGKQPSADVLAGPAPADETLFPVSQEGQYAE